MSENSNSSYDLIPELGDFVSVVSDAFTLTTGRIIYRDDNLIRIRPLNASHRAVDFPLIPETGQFQDSLGVSEVIIHEKRKTPHFSRQLNTVIGEHLEFFHADGSPADPEGVVHAIFATDDTDGIQLEDGRVLEFGFIGSKSPNDVVRPRAAPEDIAPPENNSTLPVIEEESDDEELYPEFDNNLLPLALVEEVPTQERTYSDSVQREDMFVSMLVDVPVKRQKDPRVMQELYRLTDILLALKNSVILRDESGTIIPGSRDYTATTVRELVDRQPTPTPIGSLIPVIAAKKVLYIDGPKDIEAVEMSMTDVDIRHDTTTLAQVMDTRDFSRQTTGNPFVSHIHKVLQGLAAYVPKGAEYTPNRVDQDVLCTRLPYVPMEGFPKTMAGYEKDAFGRPTEMRRLTMDSLGQIQNRFGRILSASIIRNTKTNVTYTVASADTAATLGYVLLSEKLVKQRLPIRSKVLLWDIAQSELSRRERRVSFVQTLKDTPAEQRVMTDLDLYLVKDILAERLHPTTAFINYETSYLYDTLGFRDLELTGDLMKPLDSALKVGQTFWLDSQRKRTARAAAASKSSSVPSVAGTVDDFSLYLKPTEAYPVFTAAKEALLERETSLADYDLALSPRLVEAAGYTLGTYWYSILGESTKARIERTETTFRAETLRETQNKERTLLAAKAFVATPDINTCPHVNELERIYSVRGDETRMQLFEKCYTKYQAGQNGNYILCGTCGKDFVCKHEVLLLNEFLHPGRGMALHKSLLLEFAGPVFEGSYICKVCGQKIRDIEYDTHLEFDEEGRPLVGRNIITEDDDDDENVGKKDEEADEIDLALVLKEEVKDALPFQKKEQLAIYFIARTVCERCGFLFPIEIYRNIVDGYTSFFEKLTQREPYEKTRKETEEGVKKGKLKKGTPIPAPYDNFISTYQVAGITALIVLEIQTSAVTPPTIDAGCVFRRDGFPLEPLTAGTGALNYVSCMVANIMRNDAPWNKTSWSAETNMAKRIAAISDMAKRILNRILALGEGVPPLTVTDMYRTRLDEERERKRTAGIEREVRASDADSLPPAFRPLQHIVLPGVGEEKPVANVSRFLGSVATGPLAEIRSFVDTRFEQLSLHLLNDSHTSSRETAAGQVPKRSDATCCFTNLVKVSTAGMGVVAMSTNEAQKAEYGLQTSAKRTLENRDSAACFGGTHFYVPWSAPAAMTVVPGADATMYYKIFIKNCYKGDHYGYPHEISVDSTCRRCGFPYPAELDTLDTSDPRAAKQREDISLAALRTAGVEITEESFSRLDRRIKKLKSIAPPIAPADTNFLLELSRFGGILVDILQPGDIDSLVATMTEIQGSELRDIDRRGRFADISVRYDAARTRFAECFPKGGVAVLRGLDTLTEITHGSTAVRNLHQVFVVQGTQIAYEFRNNAPKGAKWFARINYSHQNLLKKIWEKSAEMVLEALKEIEELEEEDAETIKTMLTRFTETYSRIYDIWIREIRSNIHFTEDEYKIVLRWLTLSGLTALMTRDSVYYRDVTTAEERNRVSGFLSQWIERTVEFNASNNRRYQLNVSQIAEAINARAELEKAHFIKKFDDLDKDLRKVELIKKSLKIGDWAVGTVKNLFTYDANFYEFERSQRSAMGLPEFGGGEVGGNPAFDRRQQVIDGGYDNRPAADEDV
jgi:hypothetical protein